LDKCQDSKVGTLEYTKIQKLELKKEKEVKNKRKRGKKL